MAIREGQGLGRMTLALGGGSLALFWIMVIPFNSFAGATTVLDPLQLAAQGFHLVCCPLLAIGAATFVWPRMKPGLLSDSALITTVAGLFGFFGDAVIGAVVNPALATAAPEMIAATGVMFSGGLVLGYYVATFAVLMVGMLLLAWGLLRGGAVDPILAGVMAGGAVLMNLPPIPGFHLVQVAGGVILGGSFVAVALRTGESRDETAVMPGARPD